MTGIPADGGTSVFEPQKLELPTLILHGDNDQLAPVSIARYLHELIPNSRLVEFAGGSHMLPVTHAAEIAEEIAEFSE